MAVLMLPGSLTLDFVSAVAAFLAAGAFGTSLPMQLTSNYTGQVF